MKSILPMPLSLRKILIEICDQHCVRLDEIAGNSHAKKIVAARRAYFWRARQETRHSFPRIAAAINKDHTTAIHHVQRIASGIETPEPFRPINSLRLFAREIETVKLRESGVGWNEIAKRFGVRETTVRSYASSAKRKISAIREAE